MIRKITILFIVLLNLVCYSAKSQERIDSLKISLMTCSPGSEVYALYGHTAIRVQDLKNGSDWVFNYGMFSFNTPNFIYRFVKGETDYELGVVPYAYFEREYAQRGSSVHQQVLNLTDEEARQLFIALDQNYRPENKVYRYNYFYDNCTTRARDKIEQSIKGRVEYVSFPEEKTFRQIVHEFTANHPWAQLGVDLCLGSEADRPIDTRLQMFAPFYMLHAAQKAEIVNESGEKRPFIREEEDVVKVQPLSIEKEFILSPMQMSLLVFVITLFICVLELRNKKIYWGLDLVWFFVQGVAGCIIAFLFFVSEHPTVGSNYLIILLNPLPLLYLPRMIYLDLKRKKDPYHLYNVFVLTLFILLWRIIPQEIPLVMLPLALSLLIVSLVHLYLANKRV